MKQSLMSENAKNYIRRAREEGALIVLDVCDGWENKHYPVFLDDEEELIEAMIQYNENMQSIYGVYKVTDYA